jgi:murein DD-endopeptidase
MPSSKTFFTLVIFGGLGVTAIAASSFFPGDQGPLGESARIDQPALFSLQECRPRSEEAAELRRAARIRLAAGDLLENGAAWILGPGMGRGAGTRPGEDDPADVVTSYEPVDLDEGADWTGPQWFRHTVRSGDSLGSLWQSAWGLPLPTLYGMLADDDSARILNRVHPGQEIEWLLDADGELDRLRVWSDLAGGHEWTRDDDGAYLRAEIQNIREFSHMVVSGQVQGSLAASLAALEPLSPAKASALAVLLDRHLPVREKARAGDSFTLLIEQETLLGDNVPYEVRLLAFEYNGQSIRASGIRHIDDRFYTPDGLSLLPPFDRKPFVGDYKISSGYNVRRRHPVTGRVAPHHGTDFQMPVGTPIVAPADGTVTRVDSHAHAGRYIEIEHGQGYTTRYLHLKQALVKEGQQVGRGERIALSGNTGRTTGPHLHYELHVNDRVVDAMRADLPTAESLAGADLEQFRRTAKPMLAELREAGASRQVAMRPFFEQGL